MAACCTTFPRCLLHAGQQRCTMKHTQLTHNYLASPCPCRGLVRWPGGVWPAAGRRRAALPLLHCGDQAAGGGGAGVGAGESLVALRVCSPNHETAWHTQKGCVSAESWGLEPPDIQDVAVASIQAAGGLSIWVPAVGGRSHFQHTAHTAHRSCWRVGCWWRRHASQNSCTVRARHAAALQQAACADLHSAVQLRMTAQPRTSFAHTQSLMHAWQLTRAQNCKPLPRLRAAVPRRLRRVTPLVPAR